MSRFRVTIRDADMELRGYVDGEAVLRTLADDMSPTLVIASPAGDDFNPFEIDQPDFPPTEEASAEIIQGMWEDSGTPGEFLTRMAHMHYMQALVIRGERGNRVAVEKELFSRELHHFETEQENDKLRNDHTDSEKKLIDQVNAQRDVIERIITARSNHPPLECPEHGEDDIITCGWKAAVRDIDSILAEVPE